PRRITSGPEERIPIMEPTDSPNKTMPISAIEASSRSRTAGVLVTQEDMHRPGRKNRANSAQRRRRREMGTRLLDGRDRLADGDGLHGPGRDWLPGQRRAWRRVLRASSAADQRDMMSSRRRRLARGSGARGQHCPHEGEDVGELLVAIGLMEY